MLLEGQTLVNIVNEQYYLSKHANITISDSELLPDFEREAYLDMILSDLKKEKNKYSNFIK